MTINASITNLPILPVAVSLALCAVGSAQSRFAGSYAASKLTPRAEYQRIAEAYHDPRAVEFNPLGDGDFVAAPDDEVLSFLADGGGHGANSIPDLVEGVSTNPWGPQVQVTHRLTDVAVAKLGAGQRELVARAHVDVLTGEGVVMIFKQRASGQWTTLHERRMRGGSRDFRWINLSVEQRHNEHDVLHVSAVTKRSGGARQTCRSTIQVDAGGLFVDGPLAFSSTAGNANRIMERYVDLDGDGVVEQIQLETDDFWHGGQLRIGDGASPAYTSRLTSPNGWMRRVLAFEVGQFDHDPELEVACLEAQQESVSSFTAELRVRVVDVHPRRGFVESDIKDLGHFHWSRLSQRDWDRVQAKVVACDFDGDGSDAVVVGGPWVGLRVVHMPSTNPGGLQPFSSRTASMYQHHEVVDFVAFASGVRRREQLRVIRGMRGFINLVENVRVRPTFQNGAWTGNWATDQVTALESADLDRQRVASGDLDGDALQLRWTGSKDYLLADPLVIGVLAAAPAWSAAVLPEQNRDACATSIEFSSARGAQITVSSAYTVSASVGYSVDDLFDAFGVEAKATVSATLERSRTTGSQLRTYTTYIGAATDDTVVFKGTLYRRYQYEIVGAADPNRLGDLLWIEDPVSTKVFQWSLGKFNRLVDAADQITLSHTIGDPMSYRPSDGARSARTALSRHRGWMGSETPVPEVGAIATGIELTEDNSSAESRTIGVGAEIEFEHNNVTVGASFALDRTTVHEISFQEGTAFEGTVGAIPSSATLTHSYDFGLLVLQKGMNPDGTIQSGKVPYWLVTYWVD